MFLSYTQYIVTYVDFNIPIQLQVLKKRTYLCASDYDEPYFDFQCAKNGFAPAAGSVWYTICGTAFPNRAEYISIIAAICLLAAVVARNALFRSAPTLVYTSPGPGTATKKKKKN